MEFKGQHSSPNDSILRSKHRGKKMKKENKHLLQKKKNLIVQFNEGCTITTL